MQVGKGDIWQSVSAGPGYELTGYTMALRQDGTLWAWGMLGAQGGETKSLVPLLIFGTPATPLVVANGVGARRPPLTLAPNPAHGITQLAGAAPRAQVQVYDVHGRLVLQAPADATGTATLALPAALAPGLYVVRAGTKSARLLIE